MKLDKDAGHYSTPFLIKIVEQKILGVNFYFITFKQRKT